MREINASAITETVARLCVEANRHLPQDVRECIDCAQEQETWAAAQEILDRIRENYQIADRDEVAICQDTGMACVFLEIGQEVHIRGDLRAAVDEGVRQGYSQYLRKSVVRDPLDRVNTGDNTPAMLYTELVPGDGLKITVAPKGFGSENMSQIRMLKPSDGLQGVKDFILKVVEDAGPNPCPPIVVGVGLGGTFDKAALLAKKALMRPLNVRSEDPFYRALEEELLEKINGLGIGPQGFGGRTTALAVNIETLPTHIAGLPVAVNITRRRCFDMSESKQPIRIHTPLTPEEARKLKSGDSVLLSGVVYTARDAAHKRLCQLVAEGKPLPMDVKNAVIYFVGPTPAKPGQAIGSAGPTTAYRMDAYSPTLIRQGLTGMIGKGKRGPEVVAAMQECGAVYFGAIGGAGALLSSCVKQAEIIAYEDLGAEAIRRLVVEDLPVTVIIDSQGRNLYQWGREAYLETLKK